MHANYLSPKPAVRGENGLPFAEYQLNFFTHPQFATLKHGAAFASPTTLGPTYDLLATVPRLAVECIELK
jgi:hypothetical protein